MSFYDRYELLCNERGFTGQSQQAFTEIGLKSGTVGDWRKNGNIPAAKYLIQLSRFFEVSIDYLVGETDVRNKAVALSSEEETLIEVFRSVNQLERFEIINTIMNTYKKSQKEKTDFAEKSAI
mgnify:CR=1 FL=1